jgi:hypothetical protein
MNVPLHPTLSLWQPIEVNVIGHRVANTFETAAMEAIHIFCDQHPEEVAGPSIDLFPAMDSRVTVHVLVMLDILIVSVKYVFVSVKLVCLCEAFENLKCK